MTWFDDEIMDKEENAEQYPPEMILPEDAAPVNLEDEETEGEVQNERRRLKRELEAEARSGSS